MVTPSKIRSPVAGHEAPPLVRAGAAAAGTSGLNSGRSHSDRILADIMAGEGGGAGNVLQHVPVRLNRIAPTGAAWRWAPVVSTVHPDQGVGFEARFPGVLSARGVIPPLRDRKFADSLLEGTEFEPSVPRERPAWTPRRSRGWRSQRTPSKKAHKARTFELQHPARGSQSGPHKPAPPPP